MSLRRVCTAALAATALLGPLAPAPATAGDQAPSRCSATDPAIDVTALESAMARVAVGLPGLSVAVSSDTSSTPDPGVQDPGTTQRTRGEVKASRRRTEPTTGTISCGVRPTRLMGSASTVKPILIAELFNQRERLGRTPSLRERRLARAAITRSDNAAATALWVATGGHAGLARFAYRADLVLQAGHGIWWGSTRLSARTLADFANLLVHPHGPVSAAASRFIRHWMERVIPSQRWGITAGAPRDSVVAFKNGWVWSSYEGYRTHTFGIISSGDRTYVLAITSLGPYRFHRAVARLQRAARIVNRAMRQTDTDVTVSSSRLQ